MPLNKETRLKHYFFPFHRLFINLSQFLFLLLCLHTIPSVCLSVCLSLFLVVCIFYRLPFFSLFSTSFSPSRPFSFSILPTLSLLSFSLFFLCLSIYFSLFRSLFCSLFLRFLKSTILSHVPLTKQRGESGY